jgi:tripartite-type tricarboxylate transporter receptor subunit TctC
MAKLWNRRALLQCMLAATAGPSLAVAQANRTTTLVVGFPPGGGIDLLGRIVANQLQSPAAILVDNKSGVAGRLALEHVKTATPDGSVLLLTPDFPFTIFPHIYRQLPYSPTEDFTPVGPCAKSELVLSVGPQVPANVTSVAEFVKWSKAHPKEASYASSGPGGILHFLGLMFNQATGVDLNHVPFRGSAPALQALVGGQIPASFNAVGEALPFHSTRKLRALATFGAFRSRFMPEVPTMAELGYPNAQADTWLGIFAPPRTPAAVVTQWSDRLAKVVASPEYAAALDKQALEPMGGSPQVLAGLVKRDIARWAPIVKASGFRADS